MASYCFGVLFFIEVSALERNAHDVLIVCEERDLETNDDRTRATVVGSTSENTIVANTTTQQLFFINIVVFVDLESLLLG
mmetsp:Transcript_38998/g.63902  ORF Transcript_38998/g.63902 Transcript_38998/m.63902 type:complete len:80 (-) Transcript_38998:210-449(-)